MTEEGWRELESTVNAYLSTRPAKLRRQLHLFLRILDVLAILRFARRLHRVPLDVRSTFLHRIERAPVLLVRRGLWGVRTLAFMGYYTRPQVMREIGYRAPTVSHEPSSPRLRMVHGGAVKATP